MGQKPFSLVAQLVERWTLDLMVQMKVDLIRVGGQIFFSHFFADIWHLTPPGGQIIPYRYFTYHLQPKTWPKIKFYEIAESQYYWEGFIISKSSCYLTITNIECNKKYWQVVLKFFPVTFSTSLNVHGWMCVDDMILQVWKDYL